MASFQGIKKSVYYKALLFCQITAFVLSSCVMPGTSSAQAVLSLPARATMMNPSAPFAPAILRGFKIAADNPMALDFIVDKGDTRLEKQALQAEGKKLIKYFLTAVTVPSQDLWVNLSPYEGNRIIADKFGETEMGRDLLDQDYILKQLTASLMYPETKLGAEFWKRVYEKAQVMFGSTRIPLDAFNKVWIMPDKARVYVKGNNVFLVEANMKVMLEQDYLALNNNKSGAGLEAGVTDNNKYKVSQFASDVVREVIIPELTREVNEGRNFAPLRQMHHSLVLAAWYQHKVHDSLLGKSFAGQNKIAGNESNDPQAKERIYNKYIDAFKTGVFNYIKEDLDSKTNEVIPRKYFSGGYEADKAAMVRDAARVDFVAAGRAASTRKLVDMHTDLTPAGQGTDAAQQMKGAEAFLQQLALRAPSPELLQQISDLDIQKTSQEHATQLIWSLERALSWHPEQKKDIRLVLDGLINKSIGKRAAVKQYPSYVKRAAEALGALPANIKVIGGNYSYFGIAKINGIIYVEKALLDRLNALTNREKRFQALLKMGISENPYDTILDDFLAEKKKAGPGDVRAAAEAAKNAFGIEHSAVDPTEIIDRFNNMLYENPGADEYKTLQKIFKDEGYEFPEITPGSRSAALLEATIRVMRWAAGELLINAIEGKTREDVEPMLAFAGNPITGAHMLSLLVTTALVDGKVGLLGVTNEDMRKKILNKSVQERMAILREVVEGAGGVLSFPAHPGRLNGEERAEQLYQHGFEAFLNYMFGGDHFRTLEKRWVAVTDNNAIDLWYYYRKGGMVFLLKKLRERSKEYGYSEKKETVGVTTTISEAARLDRLIRSMEQGIISVPALRGLGRQEQDIVAILKNAGHLNQISGNKAYVVGAWANIEATLKGRGYSDEEISPIHNLMKMALEAPYARLVETRSTGFVALSGKEGGVENQVRMFREWLAGLGINEVPQWDAPPKLWLNNHNLFGENPWKIGVVMLPRGEINSDSIRQDLFAGTLTVDDEVIGQPMYLRYAPMPEITQESSSTKGRDAWGELVLFGEITTQEGLFGFFNLPVPVWKYILQHQSYQETLLNNMLIPVAASVLVEKKSGAAAVRAVAAKLGDKYRYEIVTVKDGKDRGYVLEISQDSPAGKKEVVALVGVRSEWRTFMANEDGKMVEKGHFVRTMVIGTGLAADGSLILADQIKTHKLTPAEVGALKALNGIGDAAAVTGEPQRQGGIDFDLNNVNVDEDSSGSATPLHFDAAMLNSGNFNGLVPQIRSMTIITDLSAFLKD